MGTFDGPLLTSAVGVVSEVEIDRVDMPFSFTWLLANNSLRSWRVTVPAGFVTDYATVPQAFQGTFPPKHPDYDQAAVLHDFLCQRREKWCINTETGQAYGRAVLSRKEVDDIFYEAMLSMGCPKWKALAMYTAVRAYALATLKF